MKKISKTSTVLVSVSALISAVVFCCIPQKAQAFFPKADKGMSSCCFPKGKSGIQLNGDSHCCTLKIQAADLVKISFKAEGLKKITAKEFRGKFLEELLHSSLRYTINQRNQKLREYIVGSALFSHDPAEAAVTPPEDVFLEKETELPQGPLNDPLGIAVPWEQRNGQ